ncbi:MAG: sulfotransferase domain-containing protein [Acidimicrobiales bacterium]
MATHAAPDFVIIGAMKAATTSLYRWMTSHPQVMAGRRKEQHFFDSRQGPGGESFASYRLGFPALPAMWARRLRTGGPVVTGEATPIYLFHEHVPARMAAVLPNVRLIVVLREPVDRAFSHHAMVVSRGQEDLPAAEAFAAEDGRLRASRELLARGLEPERAYWEHSYLARGEYADQLERWWQFYPRSQMLITTYEALAEDPWPVYADCLRFIGVDPDAAPRPEFDAHNVGRRDPADPDLIETLRERFAESKRRLAELTGIDYGAAGG